MTEALQETVERVPEAWSDVEIRGKREGLEIVEVSYPNRLIELIVMPYESIAQINEGDRTFEEIVSRGAFDGIQTRNDKVRVNRDHDRHQPIGRAIAFHPSRQEGLVAEIKISNTVPGRDALELASDGILDASAGFRLMRKDGATGPIVPNAQTWESRVRRRLNKLWLHHIALTPDPAYEDATVLTVVRDKALAEPLVSARSNRDQLELERWEQMEADINGRYSPGQHQPPAV